jgi:hypothetical protein
VTPREAAFYASRTLNLAACGKPGLRISGKNATGAPLRQRRQDRHPDSEHDFAEDLGAFAAAFGRDALGVPPGTSKRLQARAPCALSSARAGKRPGAKGGEYKHPCHDTNRERVAMQLPPHVERLAAAPLQNGYGGKEARADSVGMELELGARMLVKRVKALLPHATRSLSSRTSLSSRLRVSLNGFFGIW